MSNRPVSNGVGVVVGVLGIGSMVTVTSGALSLDAAKRECESQPVRRLNPAFGPDEPPYIYRTPLDCDSITFAVAPDWVGPVAVIGVLVAVGLAFLAAHLVDDFLDWYNRPKSPQ